MITDAMLFNLSSGNDVPKGRMDRLQESGRRVSETGFGPPKETKSSFEETYRQVSRNNANARKQTDSSVDSREVRQKREQDEPFQEQPECIKNETGTNRVDEITDMQPDEVRIEDQLKQATEVIKESIQVISEVLQLKVAPELEDLNLENVSEETVKQFAEIIEALKGIAAALEVSVNKNEPILTGKAQIDSQKAGEMVQVIRTELFKIEIGLNMLGISEMVQEQISSKMDLPYTGGIPQASSLSDLIMPDDQIKKVFGDLIDQPKDDLAVLAKKVMDLINQNSTEKPETASVQIVSNSRPVVVNSFDSITYRAMLKLDVKAEVSVQNAEAASSGEKMNLDAVLGPAMVKDITKPNTEVEILPVTDTIGKALSGAKSGPLFETKLAGSYKTIDESVMNQISQKMHSAIRAGVSEVKIQLWPESLGEVKLRIRVEGDIVVAKIQVESQQVKQIVESNLQSLKDSLSEHNLQAGSFDVNVGNGWGKQPGEAEESGRDGHNVVSASSSGEEQQSGTAVDVAVKSGQETGRRYGSNTVEYFA
jgi:flagellar hook-length control protein FliK